MQTKCTYTLMHFPILKQVKRHIKPVFDIPAQSASKYVHCLTLSSVEPEQSQDSTESYLSTKLKRSAVKCSPTAPIVLYEVFTPAINPYALELCGVKLPD